jgi:hypothetical protein
VSDEFFHDFWVCIDAGQAISDLDQVKAKNEEVDSNLKQTETRSKMTFEKARHVAMSVWNMLTNVLEMAGVTISATTRAVVSGIISVSTLMYQLGAAEAVTPALMWKAGLTIAQAEMAAVMATQREHAGTAQTQAISSLLTNIRSFAGGFYF